MIRILSILFVSGGLAQFALATDQNSKPELIKICTSDMEKVYTVIKPGCKWEQLPDAHPRSYLCSVSCSHSDGKLNPSEFPFRLEEVSCGAGVETCTKEPTKCLEEQKKSDLEACKEKVKEEWLADPTMSVDAIKAMESGLNNK